VRFPVRVLRPPARGRQLQIFFEFQQQLRHPQRGAKAKMNQGTKPKVLVTVSEGKVEFEISGDVDVKVINWDVLVGRAPVEELSPDFAEAFPNTAQKITKKNANLREYLKRSEGEPLGY
jgi:hypothetical protein